jgi:FtsZ-binding cell division protein ZapB
MSEYNKLYNDFMNLATEVGELETENKNLKYEIEVLKSQTDFNLLSMREKIKSATSNLFAYETANWKDRFKYFLTGKMS